MSLYPRLIGGTLPENEPKIPVHQFQAAMGEYKRGKATPAQIIAIFQLSPSEQAEVATLIAQFDSNALTSVEFHDVVLLAERGMAYTTEAALKARLGV